MSPPQARVGWSSLRRQPGLTAHPPLLKCWGCSCALHLPFSLAVLAALCFERKALGVSFIHQRACNPRYGGLISQSCVSLSRSWASGRPQHSAASMTTPCVLSSFIRPFQLEDCSSLPYLELSRSLDGAHTAPGVVIPRVQRAAERLFVCLLRVKDPAGWGQVRWGFSATKVASHKRSWREVCFPQSWGSCALL